jgi:hypothetical protein
LAIRTSLMEPVCLLLKFRFHVNIFRLFTTEINENSGCRSPELGQFLSFFHQCKLAISRYENQKIRHENEI